MGIINFHVPLTVLVPDPIACRNLAPYTQCQLTAKSWHEGGPGKNLSKGFPLLLLEAAFKLKLSHFSPARSWSRTSLTLTLMR